MQNQKLRPSQTKCFNPYFTGSLTATHYSPKLDGKVYAGFNPYFTGSLTATSYPYDTQASVPSNVSILILLEVLLQPGVPDNAGFTVIGEFQSLFYWKSYCNFEAVIVNKNSPKRGKIFPHLKKVKKTLI